MRHYSVIEIEIMRHCIAASIPRYGLKHTDWVSEIEEKLRTYILNGTDPRELSEIDNNNRSESDTHKILPH